MPRTTVHTSHVLFNSQKALGDRHQYGDRSHFIDEEAEAGKVMKLGFQPTERLKPNTPLSCSPAGYLPVTGKLREQKHLPVPPNPGSKSGCLFPPNNFLSVQEAQWKHANTQHLHVGTHDRQQVRSGLVEALIGSYRYKNMAGVLLLLFHRDDESLLN